VNTAVLAKLVNELGDRAIVVELVTSFLAELSKRGAAITSAIAAADTAAASRAAHTLKSSARLLGANTLADMCQEIEHLQPVDVAALEQLLEAAEDELSSWRTED
jgi:histidine phosphotransfer protein HptB